MKKILLSLIVALFACSCANYEKLVFKSAEIGQLSQFAIVDNSLQLVSTVNLDIENPTCSKFVVKDFVATVYTAQKKKFAQLAVAADYAAVLPGNRNDTISIPVKINIMNPLSALSLKNLDQAMEAMKSRNMTVDCRFYVKQGIFGKKIEYSDIPFDTLVEKLKQLAK